MHWFGNCLFNVTLLHRLNSVFLHELLSKQRQTPQCTAAQSHSTTTITLCMYISWATDENITTAHWHWSFFFFFFPTVPWSLLHTMEAQVMEVTASANHQLCFSKTGPPQYCKCTTITVSWGRFILNLS